MRRCIRYCPGINKRFANFDEELHKERYDFEGVLPFFGDALEESPYDDEDDTIGSTPTPACRPPAGAQNPEPITKTMPMLDTKVNEGTLVVLKGEFKRVGQPVSRTKCPLAQRLKNIIKCELLVSESAVVQRDACKTTKEKKIRQQQ